MADYVMIARRVLAMLPGPPRKKAAEFISHDSDPASSATEYSSVAVPCVQGQVRQQVSRWVGARCVRSPRAWGAEKFLYLEFAEWCRQHKQASCSRELFCAVLNESFQRDEAGWQGLCLAVDFAVLTKGRKGRVQ